MHTTWRMLGRIGALLFVCATLPAHADERIGAAVDLLRAVTIRDKDVQQVARLTAQQTDQKIPLAPEQNPYAQRLARLTAPHVTEGGKTLNFKVYLTKDINAFALADGSIRVFAGLMDLMDDQELLAVIGHEIGHLMNSDHKDQARTALLASATKRALLADQDSQWRALASQVGEKLVNAQFSQHQEKAADDYGVLFMRRHNYDVKAVERALRKLAAHGPASNRLLGMFASHPDPAKRADRLRSLVR